MSSKPLIPNPHPSVIFVYKQTLYERFVQTPDFEDLLEANDLSIQNIVASHQRHQRALAQALQVIQAFPFQKVEILSREALEKRSVLEADLIVVFGGDGTILETSHYVKDTPLLGINSDPQASVGFLCTEIAPHLEKVLNLYFQNQLIIRPLYRLQVFKDDRPIGPPVLNDLLFAHSCPAATSSYVIQLGQVQESQKSSGLWISTAAGSTAAIRSAGGLAMDLDDARIQFKVREPYLQPSQSYQCLAGWIHPHESLHLISKMTRAKIYLDGPYMSFPVPLGSRISIRQSEYPLWQVWSLSRRG